MQAFLLGVAGLILRILDPMFALAMMVGHSAAKCMEVLV